MLPNVTTDLLVLLFFRSCVGRNLANLELLVIVASIFRRYHFVLEDPSAPVSFFSMRSVIPLV